MTPNKTLIEFDLYIPVFHNDGSPVPKKTLLSIRRRLLEEFGGLTDFRHHSAGLWKLGGIEYRDEIVILRVLGESAVAGRRFLRKMKKEILTELEQKAVLIVERRVKIV